MTKRKETILAGTRALLDELSGKVEEVCSKYNLTFKSSGLSECMNEVWQLNLCFGNHSLLTHLNYSESNSYFSVRLIRIHRGTFPGEFTPEVIGEDERFQMFTTPHGTVVWHSEAKPGEKFTHEQMVEHCLGKVCSLPAS